MDSPPDTLPLAREQRHHPRDFAENRYVYPVISRRSGGLSIGINLNRDKRCNFDCVYCQVDRTTMPPPDGTIDTARLMTELSALLEAAQGPLWQLPRFADLPAVQRRICDVAFSGDGEPTQPAIFPALSAQVLALLSDHARQTGTPPIPVVVISNATHLHLPPVASAIDQIVSAGGALWAKLDAGTDDYYATMCGTQVPFSRVIDNLTQAARRYPLTLQSCWFRWHEQDPPPNEIDAYIDRVTTIGQGAHPLTVQLYTVARPPARSAATPLPEAWLQSVADRLRQSVDRLKPAIFP